MKRRGFLRLFGLLPLAALAPGKAKTYSGKTAEIDQSYDRAERDMDAQGGYMVPQHLVKPLLRALQQKRVLISRKTYNMKATTGRRKA